MTILVETVAGSDVYEPIAVYDDPPTQVKKDRTTHGYVESHEGRLFRVQVDDLRPHYSRTPIVAALYLDGTR